MSLVTITAQADGWKTTTCEVCGAKFRYRAHADAKVRAYSLEFAAPLLRKMVINRLQRSKVVVPCPQCGVYPPRMFPLSLLWAQLVAAFAIAAAAWIVFLLVIGRDAGASSDVDFVRAAAPSLALVWCEAVFFLPMLGFATAIVVLLFARRWNPNRDPEFNIAALQQRQKDAEVELETPGEDRCLVKLSHPQITRSPPLPIWMLIVLLLVGLVESAPIIVRKAQGGRLNDFGAGRVVGIGEDMKIFLPKWLDTVKGYWRSSAEAEAENWQALGLPGPELAVKNRREAWDRKIWVEKGEISRPVRPFATIIIPDDLKLIGKNLQVAVRAEVTYPTSVSLKEYQDTSQTMIMSRTIRLSPPGSGTAYDVARFGASLLAALIASAVALWVACNSMNARRSRTPTTFEVREEDIIIHEETPSMS